MPCPTLQRTLELERDYWFRNRDKQWKKCADRLWHMVGPRINTAGFLLPALKEEND